ncbi:hypothetical protein OLT33_05630 [Campylobacter jejuni]|nr:hypothetical protein [Campylobacter jejuni]
MLFQSYFVKIICLFIPFRKIRHKIKKNIFTKKTYNEIKSILIYQKNSYTN